MFEIVRTLAESDKKINFVAIGYLPLKDGMSHASLIIQHQENLFEFHYTSMSIEIDNVSRDYSHKISETIHPDEVAAFIAMCRNIKKKANPTYGYFYSGESYDINGIHQSSNDLGERMTCVGFCLNVLKGFLEEDYLKYTDWENDGYELYDGYLEKYCADNNVELDSVKAAHRRITPLELLTSAFFSNTPISKTHIDQKISEVEDFISTRR